MKVIDLLNKIANGEEVPKHVEYYNTLKCKTDIMMVCKENIIYKLDQLEIQLNSRVEIIEENKKIEKIETYDIDGDIFIDDRFFKYMPIDKHHLTANEQVFVDKINEIIDYLEENI